MEAMGASRVARERQRQMRAMEPAIMAAPNDGSVSDARAIPVRRRRTAVASAITRDMPLGEAVTSYLAAVLRKAKTIEPAIVRGEQGECLHDYRVLIRKARAVLSQFKELFPDEVAKRLKDELAAIGSLTNAARDLEVYAERKKEYVKLLPPILRKGLIDFFRGVEARSEEERERLSGLLASAQYSTLLDGWIRILSEDGSSTMPTPPQSRISVGEVAPRLLAKHLTKLGRRMGKLGPSADDEDAHVARLLCKKTRYVLEFFEPILPSGDASELAAALADLQNRLGEISDLSTQITFLEEALDDIFSGKDRMPPHVCAAVGAILICLRHQRQKARSALGRRLSLISLERE